MNPVDRFLVIFPSIVFEAMPFIILGALISGALEELLPQRWVTGLIPKRRSLAIAASALLGLIFPMCECGIVPVMRRLLGKGLPLACAVAYMLAAPIINPIVIASTWAAFSGDRSKWDQLNSLQMVSYRVGLGFITAVIVGLIVERLSRKSGSALVRPIHKPHTHHDHDHSHDHTHEHHHSHEETQEHGHAEVQNAHATVQELPMIPVHDVHAAPEMQKKTIGQRLTRISETALHDFVDIACFLIIGAFLAAAVQTMRVMDYTPAIKDSPELAAPAMMFLAILLCLCSEADAFVAANLQLVPLAGKLGFLVLGPMLDIKLYFMYTRVFHNRLIWAIIPSVFITVLILSLGAHYLNQYYLDDFWTWLRSSSS